MEENLDLSVNTRLLAFKGIIGRRDYAVNVMYIVMLNIFVTLPFTFWYATNTGEMTDIFNMTNMIANMPIFLKIWVLLGTALICPLSISNVVRRLNDICGNVNSPLNNIVSAFWVIVAFGNYLFPPLITMFLSFILCIVGLILLFTPGKITSKMPYDVTKQFNWGAFFGTWIWGLFNKSYIPLWMLILVFTPWGFYFQLLCGLKGNEWAYKNKKCTDVDKFNQSQKTQATVWTVLSIIVVPIIYFVVIFMLIFGVVFSSVLNSENSNNTQTTLDKVESFLDKVTMLYFESYEITETENKFYVLPSDWVSYSFSTKKDIIDMAAQMSASQREKMSKDKYKYYSKYDELPRTKIYSSTTKELLGEYKLDEEAYKKSFKGAVISTVKAYKFYGPKKRKK